EYVGRVNTGEGGVSIAHMRSPAGWAEPGQTPDFDEYTVVLKGTLRVEHRGGVLDVRAGQAVLVRRGEWVRYGTPGDDGAEYVAGWLAARAPEPVLRGQAQSAPGGRPVTWQRRAATPSARGPSGDPPRALARSLGGRREQCGRSRAAAGEDCRSGRSTCTT